jgi:alginate O-acetyltransferase complex protein AlgI
MVFSSTIFLFGFLPAVILIYYTQQVLCFKKLRNVVLLFCSYLFYLYGASEFVLFLIGSTLADYVIGLLIEHDARRKRLWLLLALMLNIGLLAYFKYANFFMGELNLVFSQFGFSRIEWQEVILPVGISFFTFKKLSYVIDVYQGKVRAQKNIIDFALYVAIFPQLIAGPIMRYHAVRSQLKDRRESWHRFYDGVTRFCWGLAKKVLVADACGRIADYAFALDLTQLDTKTAWLGAVAYSLQIYFDFSAYSDMAIGLGMLFGFDFPENFKRPYSAVSISDFWRRWHITLGRWFRDYLYIPFGGNQKGIGRTSLNLGLVFILCGLWHGANWTFLLWGMFHGSLLILERVSGIRNIPAEEYQALRRAITLLLVIVGWVVFRSANISQAFEFLSRMFSLSDLPVSYELGRVLNYRNGSFLLIALTVFFMPRGFSGIRYILDRSGPVPLFTGFLMILLLLPYCAALIVGGSNSPFIYYRF